MYRIRSTQLGTFLTYYVGNFSLAAEIYEDRTVRDTMITSIVFLPHGMQIIPGTEDKPLDGFTWLHDQMEKLVTRIDLETDTKIVVLTPHGYHLEEDLVIYQHEEYHAPIFSLKEGEVVYGEQINQFTVFGDARLSELIADVSQKYDLDLQVLTHGYQAYPLRLNWGTSVPLYYIRAIQNPLRATIICYPRSRHFHLPGVMDLNKKLKEVLSSLDQNILLVVSGDLSHVHQEDGPYGFHQSATTFDKKVQDWAQSGQGMDNLIDLQPTALACGMAGLHIIDLLRHDRDFVLEASFYRTPTYFGMAGFYWKAVLD